MTSRPDKIDYLAQRLAAGALGGAIGELESTTDVQEWARRVYAAAEALVEEGERRQAGTSGPPYAEGPDTPYDPNSPEPKILGPLRRGQ